MASLKSLVDEGLTQIPEVYIQPETERSTATPIYNEGIPLIDLHGLGGPNRAYIVDAISNACQEWGFFQVINHGVPEKVMERMIKAHHSFFELPEEEKSNCRADDQHKTVLYGTSFSPKNEKVLQWRDFLGISLKTTVDPQIVQSWPLVIRDAALEYMIEVKKLAVSLLYAISEGLGTSCNLSNMIGFGKLFLNYYPPCPNPDMAFGVSRHSDVVLLTILLQDDVGGLQVSHNGNWVAVPPISNGLVINVGDSLQVLSNGRFQSAEHRAVPSRNRTRISIPFFCDPDRSTVIKPLPELISELNAPKYRSFTYGEFIDYFRNRPLSGKADSLAFARIR